MTHDTFYDASHVKSPCHDVRSDVYCDCVHLTIAACSDAALIIETYINQSFIYTLKDCTIITTNIFLSMCFC